MNVGEKLKLKGETYTKSNKCCGANEFLLAFLCLIFSPLAVFLWSGADQNLLINIVCFLCGVLPGIIHGWYGLNILFLLSCLLEYQSSNFSYIEESSLFLKVCYFKCTYASKNWMVSTRHVPSSSRYRFKARISSNFFGECFIDMLRLFTRYFNCKDRSTTFILSKKI